jgi:hypothetical protein
MKKRRVKIKFQLSIAYPDNSRLLTPGLKVPCWMTQTELEGQLWLLCSISLDRNWTILDSCLVWTPQRPPSFGQKLQWISENLQPILFSLSARSARLEIWLVDKTPLLHDLRTTHKVPNELNKEGYLGWGGGGGAHGTNSSVNICLKNSPLKRTVTWQETKITGTWKWRSFGIC